MSLYESPLESSVDLNLPQRAETSNQQQRSPRRADTLPVRFEEPVGRSREPFVTRRQPRVYGNALPPSRRPDYDRVSERERRRSPTNRYRTYYESEDEEGAERRNFPGPRDEIDIPERDRYNFYDDPVSGTEHINYRERETRYGVSRASPSPSRSPSPPMRPRVVERVIERPFDRRTRRSPSPIRRVVDYERERGYSPVRYNTQSDTYRAPPGRIGRDRTPSPTYRTARKSHRSRLGRDDHLYDLLQYPSGIDQNDLDSQAYSFRFSRRANSLIQTDSGLGSISDISEKGEGTDSEPVLKTTSHKIRNVLRSQYVGDGLIGGHHGVKITEAPEPTLQARRSLPILFRWIHFEDTNMDFDQFQSNATEVGNITEAEKTAMTRLLGKVKKRYDKPMQTSRNVKSRYMVPSYLQEPILSDARSKRTTKARTVSWMCVPYFCLEAYATSSTAVRPSAHPMRTLMQARFSLVQKNRDMEQAYRLLLPDAPAETCFHIAQLWFIILDESLIISCSRMSMSSLQGDIISFNPKVSSGSPLSQSTNIIVSGRNSALWSLPITECQNWFAFISHFWECWPRSLQFSYHEKVIGADDWPRILVLASKSNVRLNLEFKSTYKEPAKGILLENPIAEDLGSPLANEKQNPISEKTSGQPTSTLKVDKNHKSPNQAPEKARLPFRVFMWLSTESTKGGGSIVSPDTQASEVYQDLAEIDDFLSHKTSLNERLTYRGCPSRSREDIYQLVAQERKAITDADVNDYEPNKRKRYETKVDILNAAESLFQFFLTPDFFGPTVDKFWGALCRVLEPPTEAVDFSIIARQFQFDRDASEVLDRLKTLTRTLAPFRELFSQTEFDGHPSVRIPDELAKAYLHLLMSLAFVGNDMQLFDEQMDLCNELVELGMREIVQNMSQNRLSDYAIFVPTELASLITFQLIQDVTGPALDICETYWEYIKVLQARIETNPLDRGHQDKIVFLTQEISVITETLEQQQRILSSAQYSSAYIQSYQRNANYTTQEIPHVSQRRHQGTVANDQLFIVPNSTALINYPTQLPQSLGLDLGGVQGLLAQDAISIIDGRIKDFREMRGQASDLGSWNIQRIDSNKDRQEAAVYAFTVVTIIFLPLSTVAGILGMNTNDVRNMNVNQWVFWATALPLTVLIVTMCLVWAGEWNNFFEGFSKLWKKKSTYAAIPETYGVKGRDRYDDGEIDVVLRKSTQVPRMRRSHTLYGEGRESYV